MGPWLPVWAPIDQELGKKILSGRRFSSLYFPGAEHDRCLSLDPPRNPWSQPVSTE